MVTTPPPPPSLWALSLNPVLVVGGESSTGTVTLTSAAPSEGFEVALSSSNASVATVPASVIVPGGSGSTTFTVNTNPVEASTSVDFTATAGDVIRTAQLTVQPFTPETETVTFSGRIERNSTRTHSVNVTAAGEGSARLSWQDNRVSLSLTVRNPSGTAIAWGSGSNPMQVGFTAVQTGTYTFEINNPSNRKTDYTLQVTYPVGSAPPADTTPPTVSISAPANGATVSGTVTISASASDNVGVTRVEFFVDGVLVGSDATAPYSVAWDTTQYADGSHTLTARAFDAAGNQATSAAVSVTVANDAGGGDDPPVLDLSVSGIPTSIRRGEFFTATATVTNSGGSTASGLSVVISWQPSDAIRLESPRGSTQSVSSVAPGGSQSVSWLIRADRAGSATITLTLRDSNGVTVDVVSQGLTIQN
jgi:carbon monoxide dehydrogenase subunit G